MSKLKHREINSEILFNGSLSDKLPYETYKILSNFLVYKSLKPLLIRNFRDKIFD